MDKHSVARRALIKGEVQEGSEVRFGVGRDEWVLMSSAVTAAK